LQLLQSRWYWLTIALFGIALLGVALYYQYALGDEPCQVCIHARLWVVAFTLIALVMLVIPQIKILRILGNGGVLIAGVGLTERARYLYRLENGIGDGSCQFQLGMPDWFAVDRWMPWLFEVRRVWRHRPLASRCWRSLRSPETSGGEFQELQTENCRLRGSVYGEGLPDVLKEKHCPVGDKTAQKYCATVVHAPHSSEFEVRETADISGRKKCSAPEATVG
jgi:disulfide bond formation protein DsbB